MSLHAPLFPVDLAVRIDADELSRLRDDLERNGLARMDVVLKGCHDKAALMARMAEAIHYPDPAQFSDNWDALTDALRDLGWWPAEGYALVIDARGFSDNAHAPLIPTLISVLRDARGFWQAQDTAFVPFWLD
ncbi:barstar family protein [Solilutibacter silvestris]|uniref:Barstar (Barnase inhibitor) protein n=1 Tax=Solilutibacter silvestris TaxID=1645665 RepID=A0A2K1PYA2_9GAMM|nr:barstar family protein [Lysobacter silvestris]PNS07763.1 Barstar (barnase inhibitor) protein [Lysobacter silvestris]